MASPVCLHLAVLGVFSAGVWIVNLWKLGYSLFHARSKCVYVYCLYTVVIVCNENLLLRVEASQST